MIKLKRPELNDVLVQYGITNLEDLTIEDALKISKRFNLPINEIFDIKLNEAPEII